MSKKYISIIAAALSIAVLALSACAPSYSSGAAPAAAPTSAQAAAPTSAPVATSAPAAAAPTTASAGATVAVRVVQNDKLGKFLADQDGRTLYLFLKDTKNVSNCSGNCAVTWPPLKAQDKASAQNGVDASLLGAIQRQDGGTQVTYNGWPLYYYAPDQAAGDTKGQGVGQVWYVVGPDGNAIKPASSSAPVATSAPAAAPTTAAPAGATVAVQVAKNATLGKFLADQDGRTLYLFLKDTKNVSNCSGNCAVTWPPLKAQDKASAQNGVDASLLGTIQRQDGGTQVTYNGWPLYYYAPDKAMGDTKGQGVGQVWYVIGPDGNAIKTTSSSAPAQAPAAQPTSPYHY